MMKHLRKRGVALIICTLIIAASTLFNVHSHLGTECQKIEDGFYDGVGDEHTSINSQLEYCGRYANNLASLSSGYSELDEKTSELRAARNELLGAQTISGKYDAYQALSAAFDSVKAEMSAYDLGSRLSDYTSCCDGFSGAQRAISSIGYNESVRNLERTTLNKFPASVLATVSGVKAPELFE